VRTGCEGHPGDNLRCSKGGEWMMEAPDGLKTI